MIRSICPILAVAIALVASLPAQAGVFLPSISPLTIRIGSLPPIVIQGDGPGDGAILSSGTLSVSAGIWSTAYRTVQSPGTSIFTGVPLPGTSIFTGVPVLTKLSALSIVNRTGSFTGSTGTFWLGTGGLDGSLVLHVAGMTSPVSVGDSVNLGTLSFTAATSGAVLTDIRTRRIRLPDRSGAPTGAAITLKPAPGEVVETVATSPVITLVSLFESTIALTPSSQEGTITLVAPMRIQVGTGVYVPGYVAKKFSFVPEPGSLALGLAAVGTLGVIGLRRRRR